jgi:benzoyl-CoA reductase subunit C
MAGPGPDPSRLVTIAPMPEEGGEPPPAVEVSPDFRELERLTRVEEIVALARQLVQDPTFPTVRAWRATGRPAAAFFPVYSPQEIAHAMGMLPVLLQGAGESIDITRADAPLGSFLCSVSKSTLELALTGRLEPFSAFVFPYICDVSRNLEGILGRALPDRPTHMLHLPENFTSAATVPFLVSEYRRMIGRLEAAGGRPLSDEALRASIRLFNEHRALVRELYAMKRAEPSRLTATELYLLVRLGNLIPKELHVTLLRRVLADLGSRQRRPKDSIRVVVVGPFCEQPTLDLVDLLEEVGCYMVDDELQMLSRWLGEVPVTGDPLVALARAYVETPVDLGVRAVPTTKGAAILEKVARSDAQGVLFLTAKFCEPALEDVVLYRRALDRARVPYLHLEFEEKSSAYEQSRLQLETFVESILFA